MNVVEINQLTKYYGKARGIEDVDLQIIEGEIFGFIGPNGAGKSTTIRTLLSLIYPTSGSATIFGLDCIKESKTILKDIGYLPSEIFYYDSMRVKELLEYSASFYQKDCTQRIAELSAALQLDLNRKIEDLSYGNKKKVGIVQGLLHSPKLIILDEPTSGLDPLMQQVFFDLIRKENERGATVLFSSHILSEVQHLCDRVAIIKDGKIVAVEKIASLRENSYKKIMIELDRDIDDSFLLPGMQQVQINQTQLSCLYRGDINPLIAKLAQCYVKTINIEEPELEEIFMHYYL